LLVLSFAPFSKNLVFLLCFFGGILYMSQLFRVGSAGTVCLLPFSLGYFPLVDTLPLFSHAPLDTCV